MTLADSRSCRATACCEQDQRFLREALALARTLPDRTWPNPPVGALVVQRGRVVGRGRHLGPGQPHAEIVALDEAGRQAAGATLYVTLEPCNHHGRTPPCAPQVAAAGIKRLVAAMGDPNPTVAGGGFAYLLERGVAVSCGVLADEALDLVWPFVTTGNFARPYVELKTATSSDGFWAPAPSPGGPPAVCYLTGERALADVHARRRWVDLVLVGAGTARSDRPRLDGRRMSGRTDLPRAEPAAGYLDADLSWHRGLDRPEFLVFAAEAAVRRGLPPQLQQAGARAVPCRRGAEGLDLTSVLDRARELGMQTLMVEGGPRLAASFLRAGLVDRWVRYEAPRPLREGVSWPRDGYAYDPRSLGFCQTRAQALGRDRVEVWDRRDFAAILQRVAGRPKG